MQAAVCLAPQPLANPWADCLNRLLPTPAVAPSQLHSSSIALPPERFPPFQPELCTPPDSNCAPAAAKFHGAPDSAHVAHRGCSHPPASFAPVQQDRFAALCAESRAVGG